ncbi:conserved hypothetical protein [Uncinocarpus reesii 1704]|uniref:Uncharacterized protein n=1 Tax=Uncinocarpus reesii (strain UAMH 1704) TaxID=336963 RepID=C4JDM9_UNCRE|nr:uncharacterized protein UREG_00661 [Uncinocarpus reesii 1704]EEP75814.1 conserved hypothetical protein [Uncinocarpus reesii 1704]
MNDGTRGILEKPRAFGRGCGLGGVLVLRRRAARKVIIEHSPPTSRTNCFPALILPTPQSDSSRRQVKLKPLYLRPTSPTPANNRDRRRLQRLRKKEYFLRKQKPKPLTAREKRALGVHDLPKEEVKYEIFKKLNSLWVEYMWEVLELKKVADKGPMITAMAHGAKLASADFHGAELQVVRSRCVSRVGVKGIVVRDSKFAFVLVTEKNEMKTGLVAIPKEHTVFRFEIPIPALPSTDNDQPPKPDSPKNLTFELHGSQFENRPADRANRKFKWKNLDYL